MNPTRIWRFLAISLVLAVIAAGVALVFQTTKIPIALLWLTAEAFLVCWAARREGLRNASLALGVALLVIAVADIGMRAFADAPPTKITASDGDPRFGKPRPATERFRVTSSVATTGELIYEVTYSFDRHGFRLTEGGGSGADTYLFFGDSLTYGEGLQDDETIPAQFAKAMDGRVTAVNLGFQGLGPQNMLRLIETDGFAAAVTGPVKAAYYLAIADHADRAVGKYAWNLWSARYVLDPSGEPGFTGLFRDHPVDWLLNRMGLWRGLPRLVEGYIRTLMSTPAERNDLAAAIIARSARLLDERYGVPLTVLLWDDPDTGALEAALARRQIKATRLSAILGPLDRSDLLIHPPFEAHPSALADREIATWLAREAAASGGPSRAGP